MLATRVGTGNGPSARTAASSHAADLLRDAATALLLALIVVAWSAGSLVSALAASAGGSHHLEATSAPEDPVGADGALDQGSLDAVATGAKADWQSVRPSADLSGLSFSVADLGGLQLGDSTASHITVDADAAGWGWSRMDLATVVRHEIGHALGLPHGSGLMAPTLAPGETRGVTAEYAEPAPETTSDQPDTTDTSATSTDPTSTDEPADAAGTSNADQDSTVTSGADGSGAPGSSAEPVDAAGSGSSAEPSGQTSVTDTVSASSGTLQKLADAANAPLVLAAVTPANGTSGADTITITTDGAGTYTITIGTSTFTVSGTDTIAVDGMGGSDTLVAPDVAGTWKISKINGGSYQVVGGPTFEFSHIENITGAATAAETYRFSDHTGLTGLIDDGSGTLTVAIGDFVKVTGSYDFVQEAKTIAVVGAGTVDTDTNVLKIGGSSGTGFVGIEVDLLDSRLGFTGDLTDFGLAIVTSTDEQQAWHVFDGTIADPHLGDLLGLDLDLHLTSLQVAMNGTSENGSHLDLSGTPIIAGPRTLGFAGAQVSASAPVSFDLGGVLHLNGDLTLTKGGITSVDLATGLDATSGPSSAIGGITEVASDPVDGTTVGRSADYATLWNLQVATLQFAFTAANAFIGADYEWTDDGDNVMEPDELNDAIGLFAGGINLTFLMLTPIGGMPTQKRFLGLKGYVSEVGLVGIEDYLVLTAENVQFEANLGGTLETGVGATSTAVVDWLSSFPDPDTTDDTSGPGETDPTPPGYHVFIGGLSPPAVYLDATDSVIGVSAELVTLSISNFVHISGGFSFVSGGHAAVDVRTGGLSAADQGNLAGAVPGDAVADDPDTLASTEDGSTLFDVPVRTFLLGVSHASIFVGYNSDPFDLGADDILQESDLSDDAVGLLASDINIGLVLATVDGDPIPGWRLPAFLALHASIEDLTPVGLPDEFVLAFHGITLSVNRSGQLGKGTGLPSPVAGSRAWVDWEASFPADGGDDAGLEVPTGDDENPVLIAFDDPVLGISAERVVLAISDFVYLTGGFSLQLGGIEELDVDARNLGAAASATIRGATPASDTDPGVLSTTADGSTIWNLPVTTTLFGISHASIFVGYNPNAEGVEGTSFSTGDDAILDVADLSPDAIGFLANDINVGLVFATVDREAGAWASSMPRFWALRASIGLLTPVGLPSEFVLEFDTVVLSLNRGGAYAGVPTSTLWVNWTKSFPDPDGTDDPDTTDVVENPVPAGLEVPTGNEDNPVHIAFEDPIFGISAHNVKLAISDFVFISGGFAFEMGGREDVDVDTAGLGSAGSSLATQVNGGPTSHASDPGTLGATSNASTIWNLPVVTTLLGISHASVFVGYNPNADGTTGTSFDTGDDLVLDQADLSGDAIGFLASDINIGLVFANVDKDPTKTWMDALPSFWALKATVGFMAPIGLPSEFVLEFEGVQLTLNRGGPVTTTAQSEAWVNWLVSYPDPIGPDPAGLAVPTGTGNEPVYVDFDDPIFGISATRVTLAISDFVFLTGGFAFQQGGRETVDITTSGTSAAGTGFAASINGVGLPSADDPGDGTTRASANGQHLWNIPVVTTLIGISDASLFLGYNPNAVGTTGTSFDTGGNGVLDEADLSDDAIGLLANHIEVGIVLAKVEPNATATWDEQLPSFYAVRATIGLLTPVGLPDGLVFRFEGVGLSLNQGGAISSIAGSNAWIDWKHSFPEDGDDPEGFEIPTGLGNAPITIAFDDPIIGVEGEKIIIDIFDFVHVSGGFAFEKGGIETVTVNTGLILTNPGDIAGCTALGAAATAATTAGDEVALSGDCRTLTGVQVETMKIGIYNASLFVGYNPGGFDMGNDGVLQADELDAGAVGFLAGGLNLGFALISFLRGAFTQSMGERTPRFFAIKGHIDELLLVGVPGITLTALDGDVNVNVGSRWQAAPSSLGAPSVDWTSLPAVTGADAHPAGLEVPTGGSNPSVYIDYDGYLVGGGVNKFFLRIADFVYLSGGFYFEYGPVRTMPLTAGIVDTSLINAAADAVRLGDIVSYVGGAEKELRFMTIGAQDVHAFVGLGGPDWIDADGDGEIDRGPDGQIIDAEVNHDAVGLVLDDVDFALALMTPTNQLDPIRYIALKASAAKVALVGIDGLVATATNLVVELNISTPTLYGLPLLPVVDFDGWNTAHPDDPFAVKVAAPASFGGDPVVVPFTFDSARIRASGQFNLNVFGVLALSGSLAFNLGKAVDATLADASHTVVNRVVTMTIGGSNLLGFVGYVPGNGSAWELNPDGTVHWVDGDGADCTPSLLVDCEIVQNPAAVGLLINDLDFGLFVGVKTPGESDPSAGVFVAASIQLDSFGLIGVPGITALGTLAIMLNLGLALGASNAVGGIDFKRTFTYDPDGEEEEAETADTQCTPANPSTDADPDCDDLPGLALDSGDPANPILIDFDTTFVSVQLAGVLNIVDFVQALGVFYLEVDGQGLKLLADAQLLIGPDKIADPHADDVDGNHASGVPPPILQIGALGVLIINGSGVAADLDVDLSLNVTGVTLTASARILLNSTGTTQQLQVPDRLYDFLSDQAATSTLAAELLARLAACSPQPAGATHTVMCYSIGGTAPDLGNSSTIYNLLHNPSGPIVTSGSPGAYVVVLIDGSFDFLGFAQGSGLAGIRISGDVFQLVFDLKFKIGIPGAGLDFDASGFVEINPSGMILNLAVSLDVDVTSLFHLDVSGTLSIKTYGTDKHFTLDLSGRLDVLGIFSVSGSLYVNVANNAWVVSVSASGHFGPVDISGSGTIRSDGTFELSFSAGFQIGPDVVHIGAHISLDIYMRNTRASNGATCNADDTSIDDCGIANGGSLKFGFHLYGGAEACAFGICVGITVGVELDGVLSGDPAVASYLDVKVRGCVDLLFGDACATLKVATIRLPGTIFPENDPKLAELQGSILVLNVGARGTERVVQPATTREDYQIVDLGTAANGTHTIQVLAFGRSQVFKGVTAVQGDFGSDDDTFTVVNGGVPVVVSGGVGNDTLISNGTGSVTFNGDDGNDTLIGSNAADSLNGGSGNDYLEGRGGIDTLVGGPTSPISGKTDDDTFVALIADAFGETPVAGSGTDTYEIIGTEHDDAFTVSVDGATLAVGYTSSSTGPGTLNLSGFEKVVLQAGAGSDTFTVTGNIGTTGLQELTLGLTELSAANETDTVVLNLTGSADTLSLSGGGAPQVFSLARAGAGDLIEYPNPPSGTVPLTTASWSAGSLLRLVGSGFADADSFTLNALGGDDTINIRGNSANSVVDAGDGNDLIAVGSLANGATNSGGIVDAVTGALTVRGGSGTDTMTVDDSGDGSGDADGHLTGTLLSGLGLSPSGLVYGQLESLAVTLGTGGDTFSIDSTSSGTDTTVNANSGNDTVDVNDAQGSTTVHGNGGNDTIVVNDTHGQTTVHGDAGTDTLTVNDANAPLTVDGDADADTITVNDVHAATGVNGGAGDDTITLVDAHGAMTIHGDGGDDTITVRDTHAPTTVHGDDGADTIRVLALHAATEVYGDAGDDVFRIGSAAPSLGGVLDLIAAYLKLSGGAGTDTATLDDTGDLTGDIGYVTATRIAGLGMTIDAGHPAATPAWSITLTNVVGGSFALTIGGQSIGTFSYNVKPKVLQDAINSVLGATTVTVTRSPVTRAHGITFLIRWAGSFTGAPPVVVATDTSLVAASGLTASITTAAMSSGYIDYDTFETLALGLGSGDDLVDVDSTQTGTGGLTTVSAGPGDDVLTVETTSGPTVINGDLGADSISVNAILDAPGSTNGIGGGTSRTGNVLTLVGGEGSDTYTIAVFSTGDSRISVADGVDDGASNVLNVLGTSCLGVSGPCDDADVFLLRAGLVAALNSPLSGTPGIQHSFAGAELITYDNKINAGLAVNGLEGDDVFALDDNSTSTVINGGAGNDTFLVGQIYGDTVSFDAEFEAELTDTTRGMLTNGVSYSTTINGGSGDDMFSILRNVAALQLNGEAGDDTFVIRTFLLEGDSTSDANSAVTTGAGNDTVSYVMNAPVSVDGGDGFDTLVLIGTEADDVFVISRNGLWGAGRFVSFVGIEKVDVDGAEGDDLFVVVSTSPTVQTRIFGGLGSDTILVGAAAPIAVADDLQGHSGIIEHSVESNLGNWAGIPVDGVSAEITDNDEPAVVMTPTGTGTVVRESGGVDTYTIRLTRTPSSDVRITVSAPLLSPDDEESGSRSVLVSFDGVTWGVSATATFNAGDMVRTLYVKAIDDLALEGDRFVVLQHLVVQAGGGHEYDGLVLANAVVRVIDNDTPAVTVVAEDPVRVVEGGSTGSYRVNLATAPASGQSVVVRVTAGPQARVSLDGITWSTFVDLTFTAADVAQTVFVQAYDDALVEGSGFDQITQTVLTGDGAGYLPGMSIDPVNVLVDDNDTPSVRIIETDGGTHVVEAGDTDEYFVALGSNPCAGVVGPCAVTVRATAMRTPTRNGPPSTVRNEVQVELSTDGVHWSTSVSLVFDGSSWSTPQKVWVRAFDDDFVDGSDYQAFASTSISRVNQIQGPLSVFGGENPDAAYNLPTPYMLPGEFSDALVTTPNPAFDVTEAQQVDTLVVDNGNSVSADSGLLTFDPTAELDGIVGIGTLTGLGMGGPRTIGGHQIAGGITYGDLEHLVVHLGTGADTFTVRSTHRGRTEITGGAGNDRFTVNTIGGVTRIDGDAGNDSFTVGDAGLLDHLGSLLVLAGGAGTDSATLDDTGETDDQLATITGETVTGLDMVGHAGLDRIFSITVRGTGTFTITVNGRTTELLQRGATAAEVQAALQALLFPVPSSCGLAAGDVAASTFAQDSRCAQSVYVWRDGNTFLVGFTGELAGTTPTLTSTMTDLARPDGVNYSGLENLGLGLGSGNDGVNVRGTTAHTRVDTGAGDDLVFVSDSANLGNVDGVLNAVDLSHLLAALGAAAGTRDVEALFAALLHHPLTIDDLTFTGSLDLVTDALDIDTGAGSNTLAVSDRFDADADGAFSITDSAITGLAPAAITYTSAGGDLSGQGYWNKAADSGLFGRGVSVFLGSGGNTGRIESVRGGALATSPYGATITTVYTGEGNDQVGIGANRPTAGLARLVVHGQGGDDQIMADPAATQPLVLFGGAGSDVLGGGASDDLVFGDTGRVYYLLPSGVSGAYAIVLGGAPVAGHLSNPRTGGTVPGDAQFVTVDVLRTAATGVGGGDTLSGRGGNDILLGGKGNDTVSGDAGNDLVFGDFGWVGALGAASFVDTDALPMSMPLAAHPFDFVSVDVTDANAGNDTLSGGAGDDIVLGQQGSDTLSGGAGDDDLIGGHNVSGGYDAGDTIDGGAGHDVVLGDNGLVYRTGSAVTTLVRLLIGTRLYLLDTATGTFYTGNTVGTQAQVSPTGVETRAITILDHAVGTSTALFGNDTVDAGDGDDLVFGQLGDDTIRGGLGSDYVEGNGGNDTIYGGLGQDDLIGGSSDLFGLTTRAMRPDGADTIYGGDGSSAGRNDPGDISASGHANDADVLLGDNGRIFRMVGADGQPLTFTYDGYGAVKVLPRVVVLLDYTPTGETGTYWLVGTDRAHPTKVTGTGLNIGGGDFLHGEGGDDVIHGMSGDDALFGDGQDDDLYGEAGNDWASGGAGTDGIVGDDGLVLTSRNGSREVLNYVDAATVQQDISGNGPHHNATINVTGTLTKAVDLEPFYVGYDDVLYGGLGNDFVHGGEGDDAISGGEALAVYYTLDPLAFLALYYLDDNPLQFGFSDPEEFRFYNENNPMRLVRVCRTATDCVDFLTTADATVDDGDDVLFGDGGSDWLSGGTGVDHLYGGWGNDLLDVDDDKTTSNGANNKVDNDSNSDYAYGGAGRDVLIANSKSDRLIDWIGEYNSYLVPFNQFGASTVWRASAPAVRQFLYDLSRADGADRTRVPANGRNGEPYGELGLTSSADAEWGDQHGAPDDPQPGNGGTFNDAAATSGSTFYTGSTTTTTFAAPSPTSVASATVSEGKNKQADTLEVSLASRPSSTLRIAVQVVNLDEIVTSVGTLSVSSKSTAGSLSFSLGSLRGTEYEMLWMTSTDPSQSDLVLVIRQIA